MENQNNIPEEVNALIDRLYFLEHGTKNVEVLERFDFKTAVYKIKFLASQPAYKMAVIEFLKSSFLPGVKFASEIFGQIIAGITHKEKYGPPSQQKLIDMGYSLYQDRGNLPQKVFLGYEQVEDEDIIYAKERFSEELDFYIEQLGPLVTEGSGVVTQRDKIKTNLSVEQLASLFKILNQYDEPDKPEKRVIQQHTITKLCNSVAQSFASKGTENINPGTLQNRYHDGSQLQAAEFWVDKFKSLQIAAANLVQDLTDKEDKPKTRKRIK
ncbi:MAG TPA: hypothetical protein PK339_14025 [Flavitalea sp.]|nr:hypothetical protein [Flavitalea sp.]